MLRFVTSMLVIFAACGAQASDGSGLDRSPVDVVVAPDDAWLVSLNQGSSSVSLIDLETGSVLDELEVGSHPAGIAICPQTARLIVTSSYSGEVTILRETEGKLESLATIMVGYQPHGVVVSPDGKLAYVATTASAEIAVVDLETNQVIDRIDVGRWPRFLDVSPDGSRLVVGTSGDRGISVVDTESRQMLFKEKFVGLNVGHVKVANDGMRAWFPWIVYRQNPITVGNIRLGWVLASRIGRVRTDGPARREAMSLDPQGKAIADPHGLDLTSDESLLVMSASGTHELLLYRAHDLPLQDYGGTDHVPKEVLEDPDRFTRIELGGRPMGLQIGSDDQTVYIANYLSNSIQVVDLGERKMVREFPLGSASEPSLVRQGEAIFFDATRSLDQWYSCHSCHYEGGSNAVPMDTWNDESRFTFKTVLPLEHLGETAPWTWHGWQEDLDAAMRKSVTSTMSGEEPTDEDVKAMLAYLTSKELPPNPFLLEDGSLSEAAQRGRDVFESDQANCLSCHSGPHFTDGGIHDVGTRGGDDRFDGYNTPSLRGLYRKVEFLHDGRAKSLESLLSGPHSPSSVSDEEDLSPSDLRDLIEYLKTL